MKKTLYTIASILLLQVNAIQAQTQTVGIKAPTFVRPLVERWIAEYQKKDNSLDFSFTQTKQDNTISFVDSSAQQENSDINSTFYFGRYAIVPFTSKDSEAAELIAKKRLNNKRIKNIFFIKDDFSDEKEEKIESQLHVYTGNSSLYVSRPYAAHYNLTAADYKGKRISGDDKYLAQAVGKDPLGISLAALPNIYDLGSRQLKPEIQLAALDTDKKSEQALESSLDELLLLLEEHEVTGIDVEKFGITVNHLTPELRKFIAWVLQEGDTYLHQYGLLMLSQKEAIAQLHNLGTEELARVEK
jgi:ABC-type phosphate transport system substrate-binding protein